MDPFADLFEQPKKKPSVKNPKAAQSSDPFADLFEDVQSPIAKQTEPLPKPTITPPQTGAVGVIKDYLLQDPAQKKEGIIGSTILSLAKGVLNVSASQIGSLLQLPYRNFQAKMEEENVIDGVNVTSKDVAGLPKKPASIPAYASSLYDFGEFIKEKSKTGSDFLQQGSSFEEDKLGTKIIEGIGGVVPTLASAALGGTPGVAVSLLGNAIANAEDVYNENIKQGKSEQEALKKYTSTALGTLTVNAASAYLGPLGKIAGGSKPTFTRKSFEFIKDALIELAEENSEQIIQNVNSNRDWTTGLGEVTLVTLPISILFGTAGNIANITSNPKELEVNANFVKDAAKNGLTKDVFAQVLSNINKQSKQENIQKLDAIIATDESLAKQFEDNDKKIIDKIAEEAMAKVPEGIVTENIDDFQQFQDETVDIDLEGADITTDSIQTDTGFNTVVRVTKDGETTDVTLDTVYATPEEAKQSGDKIVESLTVTEEPMFQKKGGTEITDPLYEFKNLKTIEDKYIARGTVKEAIKDIGGLKNVKRQTINVSKIETTEDVNMRSERAEAVRKEVKSGIITPIILNENLEVIDGHHRLNVYKELGMKDIPVIIPKSVEIVPSFKEKGTTEKPLIQREEIVKQLASYLKRLKLDLDINFVDSIITPDNEAAFGVFFDNTITFERAITDTTVVHEIGHAVFRNLEKIPMFKGITREQLYKEARAKYGDLDKLTLEERIMEDLEVFAKEIASQKPSSFTGKIREFLAKMYKSLKELFNPSNRSAIQEFYSKITEGEAKTVTRLASRGQIEKYLRGDTLDFRGGNFELPAFLTKKDVSLDEMISEYEAVFKKKEPTILTAKTAKNIYKKGVEEGASFEKRKAELDKLKRTILRRSYVTQALNAIRKNIPPAERFEYMSQLAEIGRSGSLAEYNHLYDRVMERAEQIAIEKGERKVIARKRSTIAYLKMINDLNEKLIKDVKETLDIKKPVTKMSQEELNRVLDEVKNRITYLKVNNLISTPQPKEVNKDDYLNIAKQKPKTNKVVSKLKTFTSSIFDGLKRTFITVGQRLKNVSPEMYFQMETMVFNTNRYLNEDLKPVVESFDNMLKDLAKKDANLEVAVKGALLSQRYDIAEEILVENGIDPKPLTDARTLFDDVFNKLKSVDVDVDYLEGFFPRYFTEEARKNILDTKNENLKQAIDDKRADLGRDLNQEERAKVYANYFRGFDFGSKVLLSDGRFGESREVATLNDRDQIDQYEDPSTALVQYVTQAINLYESRKFFNKFDPTFIKNVKNGDFDQGVNAFVEKLGADKVYSGAELKEIQDILKTYFAVVNFAEYEKLAMNSAYTLGLGSPLSFIPQFFEVGVNTVLNLDQKLVNPITRLPLKPEDVFIATDFDIRDNPVSKISEYVTTPMRLGDQIGAMTAINQLYQVIRKQAIDGDKNLRNTVEFIYGKDKTDEVMKNLASQKASPSKSDISDEMKRIIFTQMSERRVLSRLDKSETFIYHPIWGVFRSYTVKMITNIIYRGNQEIAEGYRTKDLKMMATGVRRKAVLITALMMAGASQALVKDLIRGKDLREIPDYILDTFFQLFGLSRYGFQTVNRNGIENTFYNMIAPAPVAIPANLADVASQDVKKGNTKILEQIPVFGEIIRSLRNRRVI